MITRVDSRMFMNSPYDFRDFPEMIMVIFVTNFKNHIKSEFVKIRESTFVIILVIFPQK